jgi:hypothetical protein
MCVNGQVRPWESGSVIVLLNETCRCEKWLFFLKSNLSCDATLGKHEVILLQEGEEGATGREGHTPYPIHHRT